MTADISAFRSATLRHYLIAGLGAGLAAAVINIIIYLILVQVEGHRCDWLTVGSITAASLVANLLAAGLLFGLSRLLRQPRPWFTLGVVAFIAASVLPHLGIGPAPSPALAALPGGFDLMTVPLHLVAGITATIGMPWLLRR